MVVLSIISEKNYMSRNNSRILAEQPLNFIHWKSKIFNTSFYDTLLAPNKPDSLEYTRNAGDMGHKLVTDLFYDFVSILLV
jgi:hypothetical protein